MIENETQLVSTLEQIGRIVRAADDLRKSVLPKNPELCALMVEAPLDELDSMHNEIAQYVGNSTAAS